MGKLIVTIFFVFFISLSFTINAQTYLADAGATMLQGSLNYSNSGGDLYSLANRSKQISINVNVNQFVVPRFFIGALLDYTNQTQGNISGNMLGIGPQIGYVTGNKESDNHLFVVGGVTYERLQSDMSNGSDVILSGKDIFLGGGLIIPASDHLGFIIEAKYHMTDLSDSNNNNDASGDAFTIGVGIAGLFY